MYIPRSNEETRTEAIVAFIEAHPFGARREQPWAVTDAPAEFVAQLSAAIVGVELEITRLEGKWKMSQNRSDADIDGVIHGLAQSSDPAQQRTAQIVAERRPALRTRRGKQ